MARRKAANPFGSHPSLLVAGMMQVGQSPASARVLRQARVMVRSFDDGAPIAAATHAIPGAAEYDVAAANPRFDPMAYQQTAVLDLAPAADLAAVDGRAEASAAPAQHSLPQTYARQDRGQKPSGGAAVVGRPAAPGRGDTFGTGATDPAGTGFDPAAFAAALPHNAGEPAPRRANALTTKQMEKLIEDDDFRADIGVILGQEARLPTPVAPVERAGSNAAPRARSAAAAPSGRDGPTTAQTAEALNAPPAEHAIFDRIAQQMRFATAYELAPVSLSHRFDAFDQKGRRGPPARSQTVDPAATPVQEPRPPFVQTVRPYSDAERISVFGDPRVDAQAWAAENIVEVEVPLPGGAAPVRFHRFGADALTDLCADLEQSGLMAQVAGIETFPAEPASGEVGSDSRPWGIAFRLALPAWGAETGRPTVRPGAPWRQLAEIANRHGFHAHEADRAGGAWFELGQRR